MLLAVDRSLNYVRRRLGRKAWRLSATVKARIKRVVAFLSGFEEQLAAHARAHRCDGIICGHIHTPVIAERNEITYCNTGDWVENCSALLEFDDGELRLVRFCPGTKTIAHDCSSAAASVSAAAAVPAEADFPSVKVPA